MNRLLLQVMVCSLKLIEITNELIIESKLNEMMICL